MGVEGAQGYVVGDIHGSVVRWSFGGRRPLSSSRLEAMSQKGSCESRAIQATAVFGQQARRVIRELQEENCY
jgi:hypothetical protein